MDNILNQVMNVWNNISTNNYVIAFLTILVGLIIAWIVSLIVRMVLRSTNIDNRLASWLGGDKANSLSLETLIPRIVSWVIIIYAVISALPYLNLGSLGSPITDFINKAIPAGLLALVAWIVAKIASVLVERVINKIDFGKRLEEASLTTAAPTNLGKNLGNAAFWLVLLMFIPGILGILNLKDLLGPIQNLVNSFMSAVPQLLSAGLILLVGGFIANILRQIVSNLAAAAGADRLGYRANMVNPTLSSLLGTIVYALIMIGVITSALGALKIESISRPATAMLTSILDAGPKLLGAVIVLGAAYYIGRLVAGLVSGILAGLGVNRLPKTLGLRYELQPGQRSVSEIIGYVVMVAVVLVGASIAANMLGWTPLTGMLSGFMGAGGNIIVGLLVFGIGLYLSNLAHDFVLSAGGSRAGLLATAARVAILVLSGAMALRQMNIADEIINLAFGITLGAIAIAFAIAFGLGGRDSAGAQVARWINSVNHLDDK